MPQRQGVWRGEADRRTAMAKAARMADRLVGTPPGGMLRAV